MRASRTQRGRTSLWAMLLLVPLLHGAGAHLVHATGDSTRLAAPMDAGDLHATDEICALCVAGRTTGDRAPDTELPGARTCIPYDAGHPDVALRAGRLHARPDAPRAPPRSIA